MQEKAALAATSSLGILGCWASRTQQHWQQQQQRHWEGVLLARGQGGVQGREVRPVSQNLELWSTPEKLLRMPGNRRNQCRFLGVHAGHARISCSWYVVGYFDHTGARGGYQGHAMGRWPDMADTQTWLPLAVPTLPSKKTICACESRPPPLLLKMLCIHQGSGALNRFASFFPCMYTVGVANFGCRGRQMGLCRDSSPYVPGASAAVTL